MKRLMVILVTISISCTEDPSISDDSYRFEGKVVELDGINVNRSQLMQIDIFQYCVSDCDNSTLVSRDFSTDSSGLYSFTLDGYGNLEEYIYDIYPKDDINLYGKIGDSSLGKRIGKINTDEVKIGVASQVNILIKAYPETDNALNILLNNCSDIFPLIEGCNQNAVTVSRQRDTTFSFRYIPDISPLLDIEWWTKEEPQKVSNERINLIGNDVQDFIISN